MALVRSGNVASNGSWYRAFELRGRRVRVHQLVMTVFGPPRTDPNHVCRHKNDVRGDNRIGNLVWGTSRENSLDAVRNGRNPGHLTVEVVRRIFVAKGTAQQIADAFGLTYHHTIQILNGKLYADFTHGLRQNREKLVAGPRGVLAAQQVYAVRRAREEGATYAELAAQFGVTVRVAYRAAVGEAGYGAFTDVPPCPVRKLRDCIVNLPPVEGSQVERGREYDAGVMPEPEVVVCG